MTGNAGIPRVQESVRRHLWQIGIGICYICKKELDSGNGGLQPGAKVAHIIARGPTGPRADPSIPVKIRNSIENLMLLCPDCHDKIDTNPDSYTVDRLRELKSQHEVWATGVRQAGQPWKQRYLTVDFVNLPRILALPGGEAIWEVAESLEIDDTTPLRMVGYRSGVLVGKITPILQNLDTRATPLNKDTASFIQSGAFVSFDAQMRAKNIPATKAPTTAPASRDIGMLVYEINGISVSIRFDLRWVTTDTTFGDLLTARSNKIFYTGIGVVVNATSNSIHISAMVFGKPMTSEAAAFYDLIAEPHEDVKELPRTVSFDDPLND